MKVITESDLRMRYYKYKEKEIYLNKGDFLTQTAKDYVRENGLKIIYEQKNNSKYQVMSQNYDKSNKKYKYVDCYGNGYQVKPEHLTSLHGNLLVPKSHPRIVFRGKVDSLQGKILEVQISAHRNNHLHLIEDLEEVLEFTRHIIACEVKETPFSITSLFGYNDEQLRMISHNPKKYYGIDHYLPNYKMGEIVILLNSLRALVRETELVGINAFMCDDGTLARKDIIKALNRLSSAIYILSCRVMSNYYDKNQNK